MHATIGEQVAHTVFGETSLAGTPRVNALIEAIDGLVAEQRAEERDACAKIADDVSMAAHGKYHSAYPADGVGEVCKMVANAIRARQNQPMFATADEAKYAPTIAVQEALEESKEGPER